MFEVDELIMLPLNDRDRHVDIGQITYRVIGFGLLHLADCIEKGRDLIRCGRQLGIVLGVPPETPAEDWAWLDILLAAGIHVAGKEEDTCTPRGGIPGEDQSGVCAVASAHKGCFFQLQVVHHGENVECHQLIRVRPVIAYCGHGRGYR